MTPPILKQIDAAACCVLSYFSRYYCWVLSLFFSIYYCFSRSYCQVLSN